MTREEVDAKIVASEARTDTSFAALIGKLDVLIARMDNFDLELRQIKADMADLKKTIILTIVSTGLAVVFGVAGFNATLLNNMTASFESGKDAGQWRSEVNQRLDQTNQRLDQTIQRVDQTNQKLDETIRKLDEMLAAHEARLNEISADVKALKQERASGRK
ncbi:hypothetical protein [Duganella radicis]|uniref:Uncharacterized protein n=1 Tax=Duganella radicis TaxID=551988 RepID=A0A6L6PAS2_9BURK|nr:hypothetical protein [Duganella radicis]MTV36136.1 hypothetical protein [Duganella radicis]